MKELHKECKTKINIEKTTYTTFLVPKGLDKKPMPFLPFSKYIHKACIK